MDKSSTIASIVDELTKFAKFEKGTQGNHYFGCDPFYSFRCTSEMSH